MLMLSIGQVCSGVVCRRWGGAGSGGLCVDGCGGMERAIIESGSGSRDGNQ